MSNINEINSNQAYVKQSAESQPAEASKPQSAEQSNKVSDDTVTLSGASREMKIATEAIKELPDNTVDRTKEVEKIKQAVDNGTYEVNADQVAEKILGLNVDSIA